MSGDSEGGVRSAGLLVEGWGKIDSLMDCNVILSIFNNQISKPISVAALQVLTCCDGCDTGTVQH